MARGWTRADLARASGLSIGTIQNVLSGCTTMPQPRTIRRLADGFGITPADLLQQLAAPLPAAYVELIASIDRLPREPREHLIRFLKSLANGAAPKRARRRKA